MINGLEILPSIIAIKDMSPSDGIPRYFQMTQGCAQLFGWDDPEASYGLTDYDLPSPISKGADEYIGVDHLSFAQNKKILTLEMLECDHGWEAVLAEKQPVLTHHLMLQVFLVNETPLGHLAKRLFKKTPNRRTWRLGDSYPNLSLTARQQQCLFYWVHGSTMKQIARFLNLSPRTVESHINRVKLIMDCPTKGALIEKAFDEGFAYFVPMSLARPAQV